MVFDSDVLIWAFRGHEAAARAIGGQAVRCYSVISYMELLQGAHDKRELSQLKSFLVAGGLRLLPLSENIGHRASNFVEQFCCSDGLELADALIAATVVENNEALLTGNYRHYRPIKELDVVTFKP